VSKQSQKVLDVYGASLAEVTPLIIYPLHNGNNQRFTIEPLDGGYYDIRVTHSGLVLDIEGDGRGDNVRLIQYHAHYQGNQQFQFIYVADGWFKIQCKNSGKFLGALNGGTADATGVTQFSDQGTDSQLWRLVPAVITDQEIVLNSQSGLAISVNSVITDSSVIVDSPDPDNDNPREHWKLQFVGNKLYSIVSTYSGNYLTANKLGLLASKGTASQSPFSNGNNQQLFYLQHYGNGYYTIISNYSGYALEAGNVGNNLNQNKVSYSTNQLWQFKSLIPFNQDVYIISALDDKNIEVLGDETYNDLSIVTGSSRQVISQIWVIEPLIQGFYSIRNKNSGRYMTVEQGSINPLARIVQYDWTGALHQQFSFKYAGNGVYTITARNSLYLLDISNNSTNDGAQVIQYTETNQTSQTFYFEVPLQVDQDVIFYNYNLDNFVMDLSDLGTSPVLNKIVNLQNQRRNWTIHAQGSVGDYVIINSITKNVLTLNTDFTISLSDLTGVETQLWNFIPISKGWYKIRAKSNSTIVLDFSQQNPVKQGFLISAQKEDYSDTQLWEIDLSSNYIYGGDTINEKAKDFFIKGTDNALWHKKLNGSIWSGWENLGGILTSEVGYSSWSNNRLDVFVKGTDNAMWHIWYDDKWFNWESLGGVIVSAPAAASWGFNRIDAFAIGTDNALWHRWWDGAAWQGWESLSGVCTSEPAVGSVQANELDVFVRGTDLALWHRKWDGKSWLGWESFGGVLTSGPSVAVWRENRIDVFVRGTDSAVWQKGYDGVTWSNWVSLGGSIIPKPISAFWRNGKLDVYAYGQDGNLWQKTFDNYGAGWGNWFSVGGILSTNQVISDRREDFFVKGSTDNALWHRVYESKQFSGWENLGGILTSDPGYSSWNYGRYDVFVRGTDYAMWHKWYWGGWANWESLGGIITSKPVAISWWNNRIDTFAIGTDNALWHKWWDNAWYGWESLGGVCTSAPAVGSLHYNQLSIFVKGTDNALWHRQWNGQWYGWQSLGGVLTSAPAVATWTEQRLDVFVRGTDNALWHKWFDGNNWTDWASRGGVLKDETMYANWRDGILDVYVRGMDGAIYQKSFNYFSGVWNDYVSLGSNLDIS